MTHDKVVHDGHNFYNSHSAALVTCFKASSQYDAGAVSTMSFTNVAGRNFFHHSNLIPDVKFLDILISWTLTNADEVMLELKLSQIQHHLDICNTTLAASIIIYCEPTL